MQWLTAKTHQRWGVSPGSRFSRPLRQTQLSQVSHDAGHGKHLHIPVHHRNTQICELECTRQSKWRQNGNFWIFIWPRFDSPSVFYQCSWPRYTLDGSLWCHKACRHHHEEVRRATWCWVILSLCEPLRPLAAFRTRCAALRDNLAHLCHMPPPEGQVKMM